MRLRPTQTGAKIALIVGLCAAMTLAASAQESNEDQPPDPDTGETTLAERTLGLLPNPLEKHGIKFAVTYIGELLGNASGGLRQGALTQGRLNLAVDVDYARLAGLQGLIGHANLFAIHGDGLSRSNLQNLIVTSGIEALPTVRLYEAYLEQKFLHERLSVRFGQFAADSEFISTKYTDVFTNASLGWPAITSVNLPSGGPSPPLAAMGVRLYAKLSDQITVLSAVFDGDAAGPGEGDPQQRNRYGLNFRVNDPPLWISEAQFAWASLLGADKMNGTLKIGGWTHYGRFDDQQFDISGRSFADAANSVQPRLLTGDYGIYGVVEQKIVAINGGDTRGIGAFTRISHSPDDRNLIDFYADAGLDFIGIDDARPHDKFGIAAAFAHVSKRAQRLDLDYRAINGPLWPVRSSETMITGAYQYEATPGWNVVPNVQYIIHPGGGATDPRGLNPGVKLRNALVLGLRSVTKF